MSDLSGERPVDMACRRTPAYPQSTGSKTSVPVQRSTSTGEMLKGDIVLSARVM